MDEECGPMELVRYEQQLITQRELLKEKLTEGRTILTIIVTSFSIFLAVNAILLKFGFDSNVNGLAKPVMFIAGLLTSLIYLVACLFMWLIRKSMLKDLILINKMSDTLDFPMHSQLTPLKFVTITITLWTSTAILGWLVLLAIV